MRTIHSIVTLLLTVHVSACASDAERGDVRPLEPGQPRGTLTLEPGRDIAAAVPPDPESSVGAGVEMVGSISEELKKERGGTTLFNAATRLADSNRTLRGYAASVKLANELCSGAMIGPNLFMTAAHCAGSSDEEIRFYVSRGSQYDGWMSEGFTCNMLLRTMADTDLLLYHCPAKDGVNPGDKYGYLDFETAHDTAIGRSR